MLLDILNRERPIPDELKPSITRLLDQGVLERIGRGRGSRYILSRRYYNFIGKKGIYTRKRGLDRETNKTLLIKHIDDNKRMGSQLSELKQVLPSLSYDQVKSLLRELKREGRIYNIGRTRAAKWYPRKDEK